MCWNHTLDILEETPNKLDTMRVPRALLSLPPSLILLLATQLHAQADPRNNHGAPQTLPTAVRKMSLDEGEKFLPEYYAFAAPGIYAENPQALLSLETRGAGRYVLTLEEEALLAGNSSATLMFQPPFPRHHDYRGVGARSRIRGSGQNRRSPEGQRRQSSEGSWSLYRRAIDALARLQGRDFSCPSGTHVCSNIDEPNYCCTDGTTCFVVENAPDAGNVGCCPDGQNCGGSVAQCADGNTACPAEEGGGCCIPGFVCADIGCESIVIQWVTLLPKRFIRLTRGARCSNGLVDDFGDLNNLEEHDDHNPNTHEHQHINNVFTIYDVDRSDDTD